MNILDVYRKFKSDESGFTLIEVLITIVVLAVGIVGCLAFMTNILQNSQLLENQGLAQHIMQEGLEAVVNERNKNFLERSNEDAEEIKVDPTKAVSYNKDLADGYYCISYTPTNPSGIVNVTGRSLTSTNSSGCKIYIDKTHQIYHTNNTGVGVEFTRKIQVQEDSSDEFITVTSTVEWDDGTSRSMVGILRLYDYYPKNE